MPRKVVKRTMQDAIFFDENTWIRDSYMADVFLEIQKVGLIDDLINMHINKRKFKGTKDGEIFDWLIKLLDHTQRIWLITRDKMIYHHIPQLFSSHVYVCDNLDELKKLIKKIHLYCIIVIILQCVNMKKEKLKKELIRVLHNYIEKVVYELKFV